MQSLEKACTYKRSKYLHAFISYLSNIYALDTI